MAVIPSSNISKAPIIRPKGAQDFTLNLLPTRGEKILVPSPLYASAAVNLAHQGFSKGQPVSVEFPISAQTLNGDFNLSAALEPLTDFVVIYVQNRGTDNQGNPSSSSNAIFRFLINPAQISIARTTLESEAFARAGWQFGVWGEDMVRISMSGKTPGQYFALGLTDEFAEYSESFRNFEQIQDVFENNGYWFEGEQITPGPSLTTTNFTRRAIKMHQDMVLTVKEFIWYGMFETFDWNQDANNPYLINFTLTFIAWKERFRVGSPYYNSLTNNTQRGNSYAAYQAATQPNALTVAPASQTGASSGQPQTAPTPPTGITTATSPAAVAASVAQPTINPAAMDSSPIQPIMNAHTSSLADWTGVLTAQ